MALKSSQARLNHSIVILLSRVNIACWRIPFTCDHYFPSGIASRGKPRLLLERHQAAFTSKNTLSGIVSVQSLQYREATSLSSWEWFPWQSYYFCVLYWLSSVYSSQSPYATRTCWHQQWRNTGWHSMAHMTDGAKRQHDRWRQGGTTHGVTPSSLNPFIVQHDIQHCEHLWWQCVSPYHLSHFDQWSLQTRDSDIRY